MQSQAVAPRAPLHGDIDTINKWASTLGRTLDGCHRLPDIFRASGLLSVKHDVTSSNNDSSARRDFIAQLITAFEVQICEDGGK